ncbi:MAG: 6-phospho-beta-glucosidase [Acidobacteria bacterium]|nr:6-phospho-beta-glucosidase [Acidobacteriota bacterium]MBV9146458.1 6-phospho-beta-glucosidase [Acidobacteriota bacterium]MBV9435764.1 6-phospho-beta-glucosidase [Acidobacteriota bacterium]
MKIAIVGAAGVRTPLLIYGLSEVSRRIPISEVAFWDIDSARLAAMGKVSRAMAKRSRLPASLEVCSTPEKALEGASYVITSVRAGGIEARVKDETIALAHGLVGQETVGAGGFACAMRNLAVMLEYARIIERIAPKAVVVNFTNPVGIISQGLLNHTAVNVIGVCDTPLETFESIATALGKNPFELDFDYLGLNHLGWVRSVRTSTGEDLLPTILAEPELVKKCYRHALFPPEFIQKLGLLPTEYLYFYYFPDIAYRNTKRTGRSRGEAISQMNRELFQRLSDSPESKLIEIYENYLRERNASYFSIEATAGTVRKEGQELYSQFSGYERIATMVLEALNAESPTSIPLTVRNNGALEDLQPNDAVELPCAVSSKGVTPARVGNAPQAVKDLLRQVKEYERLTVQAAVNHSEAAAVSALVTNPLVVQEKVATEVLSDYMQAFGNEMGLHS